jgi:hypothetical protein
VDSELLRRIVCVEARFDKTGRFQAEKKRGTGFRVSKDYVLTAQHLVERGHHEQAIERAANIRVLLDADGSGKALHKKATVRWRGEKRLDPDDPKALDAVLLECKLKDGDPKPFKDWVRIPLGDAGRWETDGFAAASRHLDEMGTEYLSGTCHPARKSASYLKLTVERAPPLPDDAGEGATWAGISGSPVFVREGYYNGYLYGVVRQSPERFPDALYAVGTPALLRNTELRGILGFEEPAPPHASLVERLREVVEQDPVLAHRLAGLNDSWSRRLKQGSNDDLVDCLCNEGRLQLMVEHLRGIYLGEDPKSAAAGRIRELAMTLVPILAGRELQGGEELTVDSSRRIRLGTASANFAEALLASAYGTPCLYEKPDGFDAPRALIRVPTAALEAGIRAKSQVGEQLEELLMVLMEKDLGKAPFSLPEHRALLSQMSGGQRQKLLRDLLQRRLTRIEQHYGRPPYVAPDEEMRKKMGDHLVRFLDRLAKALPNLAIVELATGDESVERAIEEEDQLWPLWEVLDVLPT